MKTGTLVAIIVVLFLTVAGVALGTTWISYKNQDVALRNQIKAQQTVCQAFSDKMWKIIQQQAQVTDQYKDAFKEIYPKLMEGRYSKGGDLMKWVQEANPTFDVSLYQTLMNSIEVQRTAFFKEQESLIDIKREHDNLREQPVSGFFVGGEEVKIIIITSEKTKEMYATGEENDVDLFKK